MLYKQGSLDRIDHAKATEKYGRCMFRKAMMIVRRMLPRKLSYWSLADRKASLDHIILFRGHKIGIEQKTNLRPWLYGSAQYKSNFVDRHAGLIICTEDTILPKANKIPVIRHRVPMEGTTDYREAVKDLANKIVISLYSHIPYTSTASYMTKFQNPTIEAHSEGIKELESTVWHNLGDG